MTNDARRSVVVAVFRERSKLERAIATEEALATTIEQIADEAIIVTKTSEGDLDLVRSNHSVGRSIAVLTAKLMVVVPLGFHGAIAATAAAAEVSAARRDRNEPAEIDSSDLRVLTDQMDPGSLAVVAIYRDRYLDAAMKTFTTFGALAVWHAPEAQVASEINEHRIDPSITADSPGSPEEPNPSAEPHPAHKRHT